MSPRRSNPANCNWPAKIRTIRITGRATCSSGARTCSGHRQGARIFPQAFARYRRTACRARISAKPAGKKPQEVVWHDEAPEGKLDLLVTLDFRMSTTCVYSDIVLPTATWYEKNDLNTSDMHPFIHPLTAAVDPVWECKSDWEIYKAIAKKFSEVAPEVLGVETDVVLTPIMHDTPGEMAQALDVKDWKKGEVEPIPGKTMPSVTVVERDYPNLYKRFTALGPLMAKLGNGGKGMAWNTEHEVDFLTRLNGAVTEGPTKGLAKIETDIDATEVILSLAPETNGEVAVKAWEALSQDHRPRARPSGDPEGGRKNPLPRRRGAAAQDHLVADLVRARVREGLLQRRLHQRARADPVAHADRPPAALSGSSVDAGVRRGAVRLSPADRYQGGQADDRQASRTARSRSCSTSSRRTRNGASTRPTPTIC